MPIDRTNEEETVTVSKTARSNHEDRLKRSSLEEEMKKRYDRYDEEDFGCMPKGLNDQADVKNEDRSIQIMDCSPKTAFQTESWDAVQRTNIHSKFAGVKRHECLPRAMQPKFWL